MWFVKTSTSPARIGHERCPRRNPPRSAVSAPRARTKAPIENQFTVKDSEGACINRPGRAQAGAGSAPKSKEPSSGSSTLHWRLFIHLFSTDGRLAERVPVQALRLAEAAPAQQGRGGGAGRGVAWKVGKQHLVVRVHLRGHAAEPVAARHDLHAAVALIGVDQRHPDLP